MIMVGVVCGYLILINIITFITFARDKKKAIYHKMRIRESTLLGLALCGGALGGLCAMYILRHKTKKRVFKGLVPLLALIQTVAFVSFYIKITIENSSSV